MWQYYDFRQLPENTRQQGNKICLSGSNSPDNSAEQALHC